MTASLFAQALMALSMAAVLVRWRQVAAFLDDLSDGNVERLERIDEAQAILRVMCERRVA